MANVNSVPATSVPATSVPATSTAGTKTMKITFLTRTGKKRSILVDALRIWAWEQFRSEYKEELKDLEYGGYAVFDSLWKEEPLHNLSYPELIDYAKELELSEGQQINLINNYYAKKGNAPKANGPNGNGNSNGNGKNRNSNGRNGASANNYEEPAYSSHEFDAEDLFQLAI